MEIQRDNGNDGIGRDYRITVLLVDDQRMIGEAVRRMLADEKDIDFHFCQNPEDALETAVEVQPTVILQDLIMPEVDGLTLVKYFRAGDATRDIPMIVLSSEEDPVTKAEAFALGANDYLIKLPDRVELVARIRYHSAAYISRLERDEAFKAMVKAQQVLSAELNEAAEYVFSLLPEPMTGDVRIDWTFIPSTSLGGDSFGYNWLDEDNLAIYLLDVAGHGVGAALLSVSAIEALRTQTLPRTNFKDPADVLTRLNHTFKMQEHNHKFFTVWYGVFNRKTRELIYATGGHPPATLIHGDSRDNVEIEMLNTTGPMIGAIDTAHYANATVTVKAFNHLYVYSDGTFEIIKPDDTIWTFSEFIELLSTPRKDNKYPEIDDILKATRKLKGDESFDDDFSLMKISF
jgi:sigma-B regulation protein RsbU (phosphoserine phosphatase)